MHGMQHPDLERGHRHSVLLIEDHEDLRDAFVALATTAGLDPVACSDGHEALQRLRDGVRPCLILLDLGMPGMNGLDFRQEQLNDPHLADIPVAVISGTGHAVERQAEMLGLTRFLRKPIEIVELLQLFADHCGAAAPDCPPDTAALKVS
jgi:CheY-like chemotaxis protein